MAKKAIKVEYGARELEIRYTKEERDDLEERFGVGLMELIRTKIMPVDPGTQKATLGGIRKIQVAFVHAGLKWNGPAITEKKVDTWLTELSEKTDLSFFSVLNKTVLAAMTSGVLGYAYEPVEDEEGKEPEPSA